MKNRFLNVTFLLGSMIAGGVCAQAESFAIRVPFAFTAGAKTMPAGEYTLDSAVQGVLMVRGATGTSVVMLVPSSESISNKQRANFEQQDGKSVLASVTLSTGTAYLLAPATHDTTRTHARRRSAPDWPVLLLPVPAERSCLRRRA